MYKKHGSAVFFIFKICSLVIMDMQNFLFVECVRQFMSESGKV